MPSAANPDVLYYAPGGGLGHVTRAAAILRQVRRLGVDNVRALITAPLSRPLQCERIPFQRLPAAGPAELASEVRDILGSSPPRVLVVDVFPAGICGELAGLLPALPARKVLVCRRLRADSSAWRSDVARRFELALLAEEPAPPLPCPTVSCNPVLLRDADELLPRALARQRLRADEAEVVLLGVSTQGIAWTRDFFRLLRKIRRRLPGPVRLRLASPRPCGDRALQVRHYPLVDLFNGVDVVVGASGYNLFHEARACGVRGIFLPLLRRHDDQRGRAGDPAAAGSPEELEALLRDAVAACRLPRPDARYPNGAAIAARAIVGLLGA